MSFKIEIKVDQIRDKINRVSVPKSQRVGYEKAKAVAELRKNEFLEAFMDHDVTKEILGGTSPNYGINGENGNLFSFLGFDTGSDPVGDLYYYFSNVIRIARRQGYYNKSEQTITYKLQIPSEERIKDISDMEEYTQNNNENGWGLGRSWVYSVERGIPGLAYYKYSTDQKILGAESRSGTGLQRKNKIHPSAKYKPRSYITKLLKILTK